MQTLYLDKARFDDADLAAITRLSKLESLNLIRLPNVTDIGLTQLAASAKLKHLNIRTSAVTPLGLADFLESQPACQVVWDGADHRSVAEWVLSVGGKVQVAGRGAEWLVVADAASVGLKVESSRTDAGSVGHGPVLLTGVDLSGLGTLKDADLARLADCTTLRDLQLHNASLTGACLTHLLRSRSRETSRDSPRWA